MQIMMVAFLDKDNLVPCYLFTNLSSPKIGSNKWYQGNISTVKPIAIAKDGGMKTEEGG
jgi:hypothetical protein